MNASKYEDDKCSKSTNEKALGIGFLRTAAEEILAFSMDSRILDDPNVRLTDAGVNQEIAGTSVKMSVNKAHEILGHPA